MYSGRKKFVPVDENYLVYSLSILITISGLAITPFGEYVFYIIRKLHLNRSKETHKKLILNYLILYYLILARCILFPLILM